MQFLHERYTFYAFGHVTASGIYDLPSASILVIYLTYLPDSHTGDFAPEAYKPSRAGHPISPSTLLRAERFTPPDKLGIFDPVAGSGFSTCRAYTRLIQPAQKSARLISGILHDYYKKMI